MSSTSLKFCSESEKIKGPSCPIHIFDAIILAVCISKDRSSSPEDYDGSGSANDLMLVYRGGVSDNA